MKQSNLAEREERVTVKKESDREKLTLTCGLFFLFFFFFFFFLFFFFLLFFFFFFLLFFFFFFLFFLFLFFFFFLSVYWGRGGLSEEQVFEFVVIFDSFLVLFHLLTFGGVGISGFLARSLAAPFRKSALGTFNVFGVFLLPDSLVVFREEGHPSTIVKTLLVDECAPIYLTFKLGSQPDLGRVFSCQGLRIQSKL